MFVCEGAVPLLVRDILERVVGTLERRVVYEHIDVAEAHPPPRE